MKVRELIDLNVEELQTKIVDQRKQIVDMRFQLAMRKLESPAKLRTAKKTLARMLTIQTQKVDQQIKASAK
jgi:large subunit ribosomal protein L29